MASLSMYHWVVVMLVFVLPSWLFSHVIAKAGYPRWWALLGLLPVINVIALWLFAFSAWPRERRQRLQ